MPGAVCVLELGQNLSAIRNGEEVFAMKHIALEGGIEVGTFRRPPPGIDPFTASEADLRMYGLPPVPADPHHRARYRQGVHPPKQLLTFLAPPLRGNHHKFPSPRARSGARGRQTASNPAGAAVLFAPG